MKELQQTLLKAIGATNGKLDELIVKVDENSGALKEIRASIDELRTKVDDHTTDISKLKEDIAAVQELTDSEQFRNHQLLRSIEQKQLSNDIVLKGFPDTSFDIAEVSQNLKALCSFASGFNDAYKFSVNIGLDKATKAPRHAHMMSLSCAALADKNKLFATLKANGGITLGDLVTGYTEDQRRAPIYIDHRLTSENLSIKKRLLELKRAGMILGFTLRSGIFVVKFTDQRSDLSVFEMWQLDRAFPNKENSASTNGKSKKRALNQSFIGTSGTIKKKK